MSLAEFRDKVRAYRRPTGNSQQVLAQHLGLYPTVLSHKLRGDPGFQLTHPEIKQLVKALALWGAITSRCQAEELLGLMNLKASTFTEQEWSSPPLCELEIEVETVTLVKSGGKPATLEQINVAAASDSSGQPAGPGASKQCYLPHNLPAQLTPFIGRVKELTEVVHLLSQSDVRLLTLSGPGGVGKTRLALQVAFDILEEFEDGVYFISLASVTNSGQVEFILAQTLGIIEERNTRVELSLKSWLRSRQLLLVIDNFEQVLEARRVVHELLEAAPRLKVLVTSRVLLHLYGEYDYKVPPLSLPGLALINSTSLSLAQLDKTEAVSFFIQRARMVSPNFNLCPSNAEAVAKICHRLDGLPLALELAAARLKVLTPQDLLARLNGVFGHSLMHLLMGGPEEPPEGLQTHRSTIDWSYQGLNDEERKLLTRLAIFAGSCSLEAAEQVCSDEKVGDQVCQGDAAPSTAVFECISSLLDKSMLYKTAQGEFLETNSQNQVRFFMLGTLREYALERLVESGEIAAFRHRHALYYLNLAESAGQYLIGPQQADWLARFDIEQANMQTAVTWALSSNEAEIAARICAVLTRFWKLRGVLCEGLEFMEGVLALNNFSSPASKAKTFNITGDLARVAGKRDKAITYYHEALDLCRETGDKPGSVLALNSLGNIAYDEGHYLLGRQYFEESMRLRRQIGTYWLLSSELSCWNKF